MCHARPCRCSCDLIPVADSDAVRTGRVGSFCITPVEDGEHRFDYFWVRLPCDFGIRSLPLRPLGGAEVRASWEWDGDRERPTLRPSVLCWERERGSIELWHGWICAGRAESVPA